MTRTITLIFGIAVAALVAVAPAFGEGRLAGSQEQSGVAYFYANERATLANQPVVGVVSRPDSHEVSAQFTYQDAAERAARISPSPSRDVVLLSGDDHTSFQPVETSAPVASSGSGRDVAWSQLGIGLGIGIVLAFGLMLALKATRQRPLAH
jgi:hypothetical protein